MWKSTRGYKPIQLAQEIHNAIQILYKKNILSLSKSKLDNEMIFRMISIPAPLSTIFI